MSIIPKKLKVGDQIRVISLSSSIDRVGGFENNLIAKVRLEAMGFHVTFGQHIHDNDEFYSSSINARVMDLHAAFLDKQVAAVLTTIGGLNSNELLPYIDWDIIRNNPKPFIGYSDITSLHNAIRAKTGLMTYYGPCYSSFKMDALQLYQTNAWFLALTKTSYELLPSDVWTSDPWFDKTKARKPLSNQWRIFQHGSAQGIITGGNIQTYYLQAGTTFFPQVLNPIVFVEEAEGGQPLEFSRELAQIMQIHPDLKALVIGRFPIENNMTESALHMILHKFPKLRQVPVIYGVDFGHTQPIFTMPLGGEVLIDATTDTPKITILKG